MAFVWFYRRGDILLWGDAVAHINIARRLSDARNPGWGQIGTVWLPLPHLLVAPFVANDWLWRSGIGGSIPSMVAYVLGVAGVYRLVRARAAASAASLAAAIYALNPSMLYMQSTAMTESIFLAAIIWAVVYFDEFLRGLFPGPAGSILGVPAWRAIERCGLCLAAAIFTRYDGWIVAFIVGLCAVFAVLRWLAARPSQRDILRLARSMICFLLLLGLCPTLWLAHNYKNNGHPLDWLNGPYSAKAIEQRSSRPGDPPYPGKNNVTVAAQYFLKAARMNTGEGARQNWLILLAVAGVLLSAFDLRRFGALFLLWIPLPFYAFSVAYSSVPIFVPEWWPFSYYNVRYGLELLPAFAVFVALAVAFACERLSIDHYRIILIGILAANYIVVGEATPICLSEAETNSVARLHLESQLSSVLATLPPNSTLLMSAVEYVGALQSADVRLRRVVNETGKITWEAGLSCPAQVADYVIAVDGDPVAQAVASNPRWLEKIAAFSTPDKPDVSIYRSTFPGRQR
jgi:4-amino-4-deoxy-L-arabinose transferase-like glycosyltransferase